MGESDPLRKQLISCANPYKNASILIRNLIRFQNTKCAEQEVDGKVTHRVILNRL